MIFGSIRNCEKAKGMQKDVKNLLLQNSYDLPQPWTMQQFKLSMPYMDWMLSCIFFEAVVWQQTWEPAPLSMIDMQHLSLSVLGEATV